MKLVGYYNNIPFYSANSVPKNVMYCLNSNEIHIKYPRKRNGSYDMRFGVNKMARILEKI